MLNKQISSLVAAALLIASLPSAAQESPNLSNQLPDTVDLRPEFARLELIQRPQGNRGTCSVFATVEAVEFACARVTDKGVTLSVEFANWAANESTGRTDDGDFFHNIIKGIEKHGLCPESAMPYEKEFSGDSKPSENATLQAAEFSKQTSLQFHWIKDWKRKPGLSESDLVQIKTVLASGFPVSAGSYHSVLFVGYEDNPALPGGGRFMISDSNLQETEINYDAAQERFCDLFWVNAKAANRARQNNPTENGVRKLIRKLREEQ